MNMKNIISTLEWTARGENLWSGLIRGEFGAVAPYVCHKCGPVWEVNSPEMTHRQTLECPAEYDELRCPDCGSADNLWENKAKYPLFRVSNRRTISMGRM